VTAPVRRPKGGGSIAPFKFVTASDSYILAYKIVVQLIFPSVANYWLYQFV